MRLFLSFLAAIATLALALTQWAPSAAAVSASASGSDQPTAKSCVGAEEAGAHATGGDGGSPKFTRAFYAHTFRLETSLDGVDGAQLPISIEEVCRVPRSLKKQAVQLAGTDGIALLSAQTSVWLDGTLVIGQAAANALDGADTADLTVRLVSKRRWGEDEDGNKIPTFTTRRIKITD